MGGNRRIAGKQEQPPAHAQVIENRPIVREMGCEKFTAPFEGKKYAMIQMRDAGKSSFNVFISENDYMGDSASRHPIG